MTDTPTAEIKKTYTNLIRFYTTKVKPVVAASEKTSSEQLLNESAIVEIRSAFDHIMRAEAVINGVVTAEKILNESKLTPDGYCNLHIGKAYGHLYRAAYDAYDVISITYHNDIKAILNSVSPTTLHKVIPDANDVILIPWRESDEILTKAKTNKDVLGSAEHNEEDDQESPFEESAALQDFASYEAGLNKLKDIRDYLEKSMPALSSYEEERLRKEEEDRRYKRTTIRVAVWGAIIATLTLIVGIWNPFRAHSNDPGTNASSTNLAPATRPAVTNQPDQKPNIKNNSQDKTTRK